MKEQSQEDELENRRLVSLERKLYLYRKPSMSVRGNFTATYLAIDEVNNGGYGVDGYYDAGATTSQLSLVRHRTLVQIGHAVFPIVVHRGQDIHEYPTIRSLENLKGR